MDTLLERFLQYVKIDTQSDETSETCPSTAKQFDLCRLLADECEALGLCDVRCDEFGIVRATVPATVDHSVPAIAWFAHVDTSPEFSGKNVNPLIHEDYRGGDIELPNDAGKVIRVSDNLALGSLVGATIITTDGTTLLGADDKAGVAVIMSAAAHLISHPDVKHGPIRVCFTCDEEIGRGVDKVDLTELNAVCGYTLDGDGTGKVDAETFSADLAIVTVHGTNTHPSVGKDAMVNAVRILSELITRLPNDTDSPETTDGRQGFLHPYRFEGGVAEAGVQIILRDFETEQLSEYAELLRQTAAALECEHPGARIDVAIRRQYRNMRDGLKKEPRALAKAIEAMRAAGVEPELTIIRGGTDSTLR